MSCEICLAEDIDLTVVLPIKKDDGSLITMACLKCAEKSDHYCKDHERPHIGFEGSNETACLACIDWVVSQNKSKAAGVLAEFREVLPPDHLDRLQEWGEMVAGAIGDSLENCCIRALATKAARLNIDVDQMMERVVKACSVDEILPEMLFV